MVLIFSLSAHCAHMKTRDGTLCGLQAMGSSKLSPHPLPPPPEAGKFFPPLHLGRDPKKRYLASKKRYIECHIRVLLSVGGGTKENAEQKKKVISAIGIGDREKLDR